MRILEPARKEVGPHNFLVSRSILRPKRFLYRLVHVRTDMTNPLRSLGPSVWPGGG